MNQQFHKLIGHIIGGGDGEARGAMPPLLWDTEDRDALIELSGSGYSNRAVTVFRETVQQAT